MTTRTPEEWASFIMELAFPGCHRQQSGWTVDGRRAIAVPIADAIRQAVAEEREACARVAENQLASWGIPEAIRARGNA